MANEAQRGLDWRKEHGRGGTEVGVARARQLVNRQELSADTVRRMHSYFSRHEVDKQGEGYKPDQDGYPSAGRIAWALWGGNSGQSWARSKDRQLDNIDEERGISDNVETEKIGDEMEKRHIVDVQELEDAYVITFAKPRQEELETSGNDEIETSSYHEEERISRADLTLRAMELEEKTIDMDKRTVSVGVSSETPVERSFGQEVIDHSRENMNLDFLNSGRAPLLMNHDMEQQIGVVESVELDENARRLRARVRFGKGERASEVFDDVADGIRQNISVGYRIDKRVERENDPENYYRVATTPMEISIVGIPADQSNQVGVGRALSETLKATPIDERNDKMSENIDLEAVKAEAAKTAQRNAKDIMTLARKHNKADLGEEALGRGLSIDEFRGELLESIGNQPLETPASVVDAPVKDQRAYSLSKMLRAQVTQDWSGAKLEQEMHQEIVKNTGKEGRGIYVPDFAWGARSGVMTTAATGAISGENVTDNFVPTIQRGDLFIEALRARQIMSGLGVTYMSGLTNRVRIPKFSAGATAAFVEESGDVSDQSQTDAAVTLQPRTLGANATMSRLLMLESVPSIEQVVQNDLLRSLADAIEYYAIQGSGSSGQPTGLLNTSNVGNVDISVGTDVAALTWADITDLVKTVEDSNGIINQNALGWLSNPKVKAKLANTVKVATTDSIMLLNDPWNNIYGYRAEFTTNVPSNLDSGDGGADASAFIFGDFSQLMVGLFGAPSILVDPYTASASGDVTINVHQEVDVAVRNAESFAITDEVSTA
jgi:HK97 family phage major capsid protein/HK97 family phage prohead protease